MIINYFGQSYFKLESRGIVIAIDPYSEEIGLKPPRFKADIVLISHDHPDHNNLKAILGDYFLVKGPAEVEKSGIFIEGLMSFHDSRGGRDRGLNTVFVLEAENLRIAHLGDLGEKILKEEILEKLSDIDILMIPVGGNFTIDAEAAVSVINQIEPKIVIPMHYALPGLKIKLDSLDKFLKVFGRRGEEMDKLTVRPSDLPAETKLIILKSQK